MPVATKKNLYLDRPSKSRGYMSGEDVTWTGEPTSDHIYQWYVDMGLIAKEEGNTLLSECIVTSGQIGNNVVLAKNRDRTYTPTIAVVRKLSKKGIEMVVIFDKNTGYVEGMNELGIGVINSTLLNDEDSRPRDGYNRGQGNVIHRALCCNNLQDAIDILCYHKGGLEGHSIVSDGKQTYHVEKHYQEKPHFFQVDPKEGFNVRTNHGVHFPHAGYQVDDGDNYVSSQVRKAIAEVDLQSCESLVDISKVLRSQNFTPESNFNMHRRTEKMRTTNQLLMDLNDKIFQFHHFPSQCNFCGIEDYTPEGYDPKIKIKITDSKH